MASNQARKEIIAELKSNGDKTGNIKCYEDAIFAFNQYKGIEPLYIKDIVMSLNRLYMLKSDFLKSADLCKWYSTLITGDDKKQFELMARNADGFREFYSCSLDKVKYEPSMQSHRILSLPNDDLEKIAFIRWVMLFKNMYINRLKYDRQ